MPDQVEIADYYDASTRLMLTLGRRRASGAIHRELWAPGVRTRNEALEYVNRLVEERLRSLSGSWRPTDETQDIAGPRGRCRVYDLGCGVGATALYLAARLPVHVTGVSTSGHQVRLATSRAQELEFSGRCAFETRNFLEIRDSGIDAAYAIESFVYTPDAARFFRAAAELVRPGGLLVLIDDFLDGHFPAHGQRRPQEASRRRRTIELFEQGWRINTLADAASVAEAARNSGFDLAESLDLTSCVRRSPKIFAFFGLLARFLPRWIPYARNLAGDAALQICIRNGWTRYLLLSFIRRDDSE